MMTEDQTQTKTALEVAERLENHNAWRRGEYGHEMGSAKQLGLDIDFAIKFLRSTSKPQ